MDQLPWDGEAIVERDGHYPGLNSSENDAAMKKGYVDLGLVDLKNIQDPTKFGQVVGGKVAQAMTVTGKDTAFIRDPGSIVGTKGVMTPQIMDAVRRYFRDQWMEESFLEAEREMDRPGNRAAVLSTAADQVMSCRVDISRVQGKSGAGYKVTLVPGPRETFAVAEKMVARKTHREEIMGPFGRKVKSISEELGGIVGGERASRIIEHMGIEEGASFTSTIRVVHPDGSTTSHKVIGKTFDTVKVDLGKDADKFVYGKRTKALTFSISTNRVIDPWGHEGYKLNDQDLSNLVFYSTAPTPLFMSPSLKAIRKAGKKTEDRITRIKQALQERKKTGTVIVTYPKGTTGIQVAQGAEPEEITHHHPVTGKKTVYPKGKGWKMVFGDWRKVKEDLASVFGDAVAEEIIEEIMRQAGMAAWDLTEGKEFLDVEKDLNGLQPEHPGWLPKYMQNILTLVDKRFREDPTLKVVFIKDPEHRLADPKNKGSIKKAVEWMANDLRLWVSGMGRGPSLQPWMDQIIQRSTIAKERVPSAKRNAIDNFLDMMEDAFKRGGIAVKIDPVTGTTAEGWKVSLSKSPMEFGVELANKVHAKIQQTDDYMNRIYSMDEPHDVDVYADQMADAAEAQRHHEKGYPS